MIGMYIQKGDVVIYESTVYPGQHEKYVFLSLNQVLNSNLMKTFFVVIHLRESILEIEFINSRIL